MSVISPNFKIFLYNKGLLIGEILEVAEFSFGEKENDFVDSELSLICNKTSQDILENFVCNCEIRVLMKINEDFKLVWAGKSITEPSSGVDEKGIFTKKATFWHIGKVFTNLVQFSKNYTDPTEEALIAGDIIDWVQNPAFHLAKYSLVLAPQFVDFNVSLDTLMTTGNSRTIDLSKDTTIFEALKQVITSENPTTDKKTWQITPSIKNNTYSKFNFYYNKITKAVDSFNNPVLFTGICANDSLISNTYQDITKISIKSEIPYTCVVASGDSSLKVAVLTDNLQSLNDLKFRPKYISYKNVKDLTTLTNFAISDLKKLESPVKIIEFEIGANNLQVGLFGAGDWIKIDFENRIDPTSSVKGEFRVNEVKIIFDKDGNQKCQLKVSQTDFPDQPSLGFSALISRVNQNNQTLKIITQN
jgi:hypothetical protein